MAKRALLIGINEYQVPGANLRGCVNDVRNIKGVLTERYGFPAANVTTLADGAATKKAMEAGISALVKASKKGDVAVLHYSGHGSNVPDDNGDEADGRDEILCPTNLDWNDPFRDDWLRKAFDRMAAGVTFVVIMDCCHSGSNTRAILPPDAPVIPRYLPSPWSLMQAESGRRVTRGVSQLRRSAPRARRSKDVVTAEMPEILITGCRDTQTSADAFLGGSFNGALTHALVSAMRAAKRPLSYRQLHDNAVATLKKGRFEQVPQLEGKSTRFDAPLFEPT